MKKKKSTKKGDNRGRRKIHIRKDKYLSRGEKRRTERKN